MVVDSLPYGGDGDATLPMPTTEMEGLAKNYQELPETPILPSGPVVPSTCLSNMCL